ncbi:TPA: hypothetical protein ACX6SH_001876 [Photobacterium damselae]
MDISRRNVVRGFAATPVALALSGCGSGDDTLTNAIPHISNKFNQVTLDRLIEQLGGDETTAMALHPFIKDACFNMELKPIDLRELNAVVAYAFGNRPNISGDPNDLAEPGPMNKDLADCCAAIYRQNPIPMYVQWEIAHHLSSSEYMDIPAADIISIKPYWDDNGRLVYLSTEGVAKAVVENYYGNDASSMGKVGIVGHRDHAKRCLLTSESLGMDAYHVKGLELPVWYDELSAQPWTRKRNLYVLQDMAVQLFTLAQINIAKG